MTITLWRFLCLVAAAVCLLGTLTLMFARFLKNKYYHNFTKDELMSKSKLTNTKNSIFFTSGETKKYIKKYAVCKTAYDKYLVCNFTAAFKSIRYFVIEYTARRRVICVQQIDETSTGESSKIITLHRRCKYVNVVVGTVEGTLINSNVIRPLSKKRLHLYALIKSLTLAAGLFVLRHIILEVGFEVLLRLGRVAENSLKLYLSDAANYITSVACLGVGLLSYVVTLACFHRKNGKERNGGALEYEFL